MADRCSPRCRFFKPYSSMVSTIFRSNAPNRWAMKVSCSLNGCLHVLVYVAHQVDQALLLPTSLGIPRVSSDRFFTVHFGLSTFSPSSSSFHGSLVLTATNILRLRLVKWL